MKEKTWKFDATMDAQDFGFKLQGLLMWNPNAKFLIRREGEFIYVETISDSEKPIES